MNASCPTLANKYVNNYKIVPINFTLPKISRDDTIDIKHLQYFRSTPRYIHDGLPLISYIPKNCSVLSVPHLIELGKIWEDWQYDLISIMYNNDTRLFVSDYMKSKNDREVVILHTNEVLLSYREYVFLRKLYNHKFNKNFDEFFDEVQEKYKDMTKPNELDKLLQKKISESPVFLEYVSIICKQSDVTNYQ